MHLGRTGSKGEAFAEKLVKKKGFAILWRNFQCRSGEIDIIARNADYIIFVEVKTRSNDCIYRPVEAVNQLKKKKIYYTALAYLSQYPCNLQPRFDVVEILIKKGAGFSVDSYNYIENAFEVGEFI